MTIKDFIQKAIEGEWRDYPLSNEEQTRESCRLGWRSECEESILLDPKAWEAVGKVEGWGIEEEHPHRHQWYANMHNMIDTLIEGKSIEDYLKTL